MEDEINLIEIFEIIWNKKFFISVLTSIFALISIGYSLYLPNIYTSSSILVPVSTKDALTSQLSNYSNIANLAGIDLPNESLSKTAEAVQRVKSFDFFSNYFLPNIKLENIMAVKKWEHSSGKIIYNKSMFDEISSKWIRKPSFQKSTIPSNLEAYRQYIDILTIYQDKKSSFVTISINHKSPIIAQKWVDIIVKNINESMRKEDINLALNSIDFLEKSSKSTNLQSTKDSITVLLEKQLQILMLASANDSYVLKVIDSAYIPDKKSGPKRINIVIFITLLGLLFSIIYVLIQNYRNTSN